MSSAPTFARPDFHPGVSAARTAPHAAAAAMPARMSRRFTPPWPVLTARSIRLLVLFQTGGLGEVLELLDALRVPRLHVRPRRHGCRGPGAGLLQQSLLERVGREHG